MGGSNMDVKALRDIPPWEWPAGAGKIFLDILRGGQAAEADRLLAAELAGDFTVINDELADALLSILRSDDEPEKLRGQAAISLGPVLEHADTHGFDAQILEALDSTNPDVHYEAVCAAGAWGVHAAWPHIAALVTSGETDKPLLLAAIEALPSVRPREAAKILDDLTDADDEDIVE